MRDTPVAGTRRGAESWNYIYIVLGFVVAIEGTVIQMITPLTWPYNVIAYLAVAAITIWFFQESAWFHNKLIGWKHSYENKFR